MFCFTACSCIELDLMKIGKSFDVLIDDDSEDNGLALRASFLVDPSGTLRHSSVSDLPVGRSVDEALRVIAAFQYADANPGKVRTKKTGGSTYLNH